MTKKPVRKRKKRKGLPEYLRLPTPEEIRSAIFWRAFYSTPMAISASMILAVKAGGTASSTVIEPEAVNKSHQTAPAGEDSVKPEERQR